MECLRCRTQLRHKRTAVLEDASPLAIRGELCEVWECPMCGHLELFRAGIVASPSSPELPNFKWKVSEDEP